jgi:glutamine synthetase
MHEEIGGAAFHDASQPRGMPLRLKHFIGRLQRHLGDRALVFMPTVNSYRRLAPGTFAPPGLT